MTQENRKNRLKNLIGIFVLLTGAILLTSCLYVIKMQPSGGDVWGHLYKSQVMYESIGEGNWYPLFDLKWYNGIQLYRYWAPFSYYLMSGLLWFTSGNLLGAYYLLAGVVFFFGGLPWVIWGNIEKRRVMGTLFGVLWFFMPETVRIYFCAGNLPQMVTTVIVPYIILSLWLFIRKKQNGAAFGLYAGMLLMSFTHLMVTAIMGLSAFIYLVIDEFQNKDWKRKFQALVIMVTGIMTAGIWVVPSLKGGMVTAEQGGDSVMSTLIYPLSTSLNPFNRLWGERDTFYFGLGIVILSILGIMLAKGQKKAGFVFLLVILVFTTPATYNILSKLPFSQLFWMTRFTPMVYGFFFCSMLEWTRLKKKYCVIAMGILLLDLGPSFILSQYTVITPDTTISDVEQLRGITSQRAAIVDISSYGSYPAYGICGDDGVNYTYGWSWQGAVTGDNIVLLNEALEKENYLFLFDRCLELGNDTVLIRKIHLGRNGASKEEMEKAAGQSGYVLVKETGEAYLFKRETPEQFGVISEYQGIVIGKYANAMTTTYPCFEAGGSEQLDDYSFEDLKDYRVIFLSGFTYKDKNKAETLLVKLAENNVRIVIDTTHLPSDSRTKQETFLNVTNQQVHFQNRYPELYYNGQILHADNFTEEDSDFSTGYIAGVDHVLGSFYMGSKELTFLGYNEENPNIYFLGINLMYHATETGDQTVLGILNEVLGVSNEQLPVRELVPIKIELTENVLRIQVEDNSKNKENDTVIEEGTTVSRHIINTTIAYQDIFESAQEINEKNNLLVIQDADTEIVMHYPLFTAGLAVSLLGLLGGMVMFLILQKENRNFAIFCKVFGRNS